MSPPLLGILEEGQSNVSLPVSSIALDNICPKNSELKERNYMGLSDCSSVDSSAILGNSERNKYGLNLKGTELRLGLPGSRSPERDVELCLQSPGKLDEKPLFSFLSSKEEVLSKEDIFSPLSRNITLGNKRGFSEKGASGNTGNPLAAKAQVIGWPPVKSYRKNTLSTTSKNNDEKHNQEVDGKPGPGALYVKVSMDGAPYLRKVDLRAYSSYHNLSSALEKMFSCFTLGKCGPHGAPGMESLSESKLRDLLHGSEYALAYEDKDLDWMLVGDVPWEMFIDSCKRLRIMKSSDAIGLAPRATEKCKDGK